MEDRLKLICASCGEMMRDGIEPVSYGICIGCLREKYPVEYEKLKGELRDYKEVKGETLR